MQESPLTTANSALLNAVAGLRAAMGAARDEDLLRILSLCERVTRELEQTTLATISQLESRGVFAARGYSRAAAGVADLLGWDHTVARRTLRLAGQVMERSTLTGDVLAPRLPATARERGVSMSPAVLSLPVADRRTSFRFLPQARSASRRRTTSKCPNRCSSNSATAYA